MPRFLAILAAVGVLLTGCRSGDEDARTGLSAAKSVERLAQAISANGLRAHLAALQRIAAANDGTRASGTPGYDASAEYVLAELRRAGYEPRLQRFDFTFSRELAPPQLARTAPEPVDYEEGADFIAFGYSGSGDVEAPVEAVDVASMSSGCEPADFAEFEADSVALLRRGGCFFLVKVGNAVTAGAAAVLIFNDGSPGHKSPLEATLVRPARVPALSLANEVGEELAAQAQAGPVRVRVHTSFEAVQRQTANVLADLPGSQDEPPILLGGHLDSIATGPGINDNGSGVATLLEIATEARRLGYRPQRPIRFAFWAAEEVGLVGSTKYVESLGEDPRTQIDSVVNLDMVGSPNAEAFVYDADATIEAALAEALRGEGLNPIPIDIEGRSDHAAFEEAGIRVGGVLTGTDEPGPNGEPHDPCYHRPCDTIENVDLTTLEEMADVVVAAVFGHLTADH